MRYCDELLRCVDAMRYCDALLRCVTAMRFCARISMHVIVDLKESDGLPTSGKRYHRLYFLRILHHCLQL